MCFPWINDCISPFGLGSNNLLFNSCMADSSARWYMNQASIFANNFFSPYSYQEDMMWANLLNPVNIFNNACNTVLNGGNMWNNWGNLGNYGSVGGGTTPSTPSTKKDDNLTPEEKTAKEDYEELKSLLTTLKSKLNENDDRDVIAAIEENTKDSDKSYKERYDALKEIFDSCVKISRIKDIIEETVYTTYKLDNSYRISNKNGKYLISNLLMEIGHPEFCDDTYKEKANIIRNMLNEVDNSQPNMKDHCLDNITKDNVLGVISIYNTDNSKNLAQAVYDKFKNFDDKGKKEGILGIKHMVNALKDKAADIIAQNKALDNNTKTAIENAKNADALNITDASDVNVNFVQAFNTLYALIRLTTAKAIQEAFKDTKFKDIITPANDIKTDLEGEKLGTLTIDNTIVDLGEIMDKIKIKDCEKVNLPHSEEGEGNNNENTPPPIVNEPTLDWDKMTTDTEIIQACKEQGILEEVANAKCDNLQVYKEKTGKKRLFVIKNRVFKLVKSEEENGQTTYKLDGNTTFKAIALDIAKQDAVNREATLKNIEGHATKIDGAQFTSSGELNTTATDKYNVYEVTVGGNKLHYIVNDKGGLTEVYTDNEGTYLTNNNKTTTLDDLIKEIDKAEQTEQEQTRNDKISNLDKKLTLDMTKPIKVASFPMKNWSEGKNNFSTFTRNQLEAYKNAPEGYDQDTWNKAFEDLVNYYIAVYNSLENIAQSSGDIKKNSSNWWDIRHRNMNPSADYPNTPTEYGSINGVRGVLYTVNGVAKSEENKSTYALREANSDFRSVNYETIKSQQQSETGLYIVCTYSKAGSNHFVFYLDPEMVFKKFKEILASYY